MSEEKIEIQPLSITIPENLNDIDSNNEVFIVEETAINEIKENFEEFFPEKYEKIPSSPLSILEKEIEPIIEEVINVIDRIIDIPLENIEESIENIKEPLEKMEESIENIIEPLEKMEESIENIKEPIEKIEESIENIKEPIEKMEDPFITEEIFSDSLLEKIRKSAINTAEKNKNKNKAKKESRFGKIIGFLRKSVSKFDDKIREKLRKRVKKSKSSQIPEKKIKEIESNIKKQLEEIEIDRIVFSGKVSSPFICFCNTVHIEVCLDDEKE